MAKKFEAPATREEIFLEARARVADLYSYLKTAAYDQALPVTDGDREGFKRLAKRASGLLEAVNAQGRTDGGN